MTRTTNSPYLFAGGGLMTWKYDYTSIGGDSQTESIFSYSAGGGLELIVARKLGLSAEVGYGKLSVSAGAGVTTILFGSGIHFYIR